MTGPVASLAKKICVWGGVLFFCVPNISSAQESVLEPKQVARLFQSPCESWDNFVARTARELRDYTYVYGFEAGGWFCVNPDTGQGAISLSTDHSQMSISAGRKGCPHGGYELTREFIHSHPSARLVIVSKHDAEGYPGPRLRIGQKLNTKNAAYFSKPDRAIGPGYLVHGNNLYYQLGGPQITVRHLARDHMGRSIKKPVPYTNFALRPSGGNTSYQWVVAP